MGSKTRTTDASFEGETNSMVFAIWPRFCVVFCPSSENLPRDNGVQEGPRYYSDGMVDVRFLSVPSNNLCRKYSQLYFQNRRNVLRTEKSMEDETSC